MKTTVKILAVLIAAGSLTLNAQDLPDANYIVKQTQDRDDGQYMAQEMKLELITKSGKTRTQETKIFRKYFGEERRQVIFYTYPGNVAGTSFLVYDYPNADTEDDQWLYLPALRKTRRISAANRGDYFLGTDLTYEDIKLGPKINDHDYVHKTIGIEEIEGRKCYVVESVPVNEKTAKELGYSKTKAWVDADIWIVRKGDFWDIAGNKLKTVSIGKIESIQGIWTPQLLRVENHKTDHITNFIFSNTDYSTPVDDEIFTENALERGL